MDFWHYQRRRLIALWYVKYKNRLKKRNRRRFHIRKIFQNREQQGDYHNLVQEMRLYEAEKYFNYFRMDSNDFDTLVNLVGPRIARQYHTRDPISPQERLAVTLRYLATGDSMVSLSYAFRIGVSTISDIIYETCTSLWDALKDDVLLVPSQEKWLAIEGQFRSRWNLPNCVGAVDRKHVIIQAPPNSGSEYYNYKGTFSIVLMALCDADYKFTLVDIGATGRRSDGGIFRQSEFGRRLLNNELNLPATSAIDDNFDDFPYYIVGDEAFPLCTNIMRPYPGHFLSLEKRVFNYRLSRARRTIENVFGILASKWRIFRKPILAKITTVESIIQATVCLHNWLKIRDGINHLERKYCHTTLVDTEDAEGNIIEGEWRNDENQSNNLLQIRHMGESNYSRDAASIRSHLTTYFMCEGAIDNQWNK